jgi:hypothetical protein
MKNTAMQELIDNIDFRMCSTKCSESEREVLKRVTKRATELLETEREQIEEAYEDALIKMGTATNERQYAEQYYKDTYQ